MRVKNVVLTASKTAYIYPLFLNNDKLPKNLIIHYSLFIIHLPYRFPQPFYSFLNCGFIKVPEAYNEGIG